MTEDSIRGGQIKDHRRKYKEDSSWQRLCGGHDDRITYNVYKEDRVSIMYHRSKHYEDSSRQRLCGGHNDRR